MTDEEWSERIAKEKKARADAVALLCQALQKAGVPLISLEIFDRGASDCMVKATFEWGERMGKHLYGRHAHGALGHPAADPGA